MSAVLAMAGSNSSCSINYQLVKYTAGLMQPGQVNLAELALLDVPMFSEDLEKSEGIPQTITELYNQIRNCRGLILSVNEHNGNPSAFFKNILDWISRMERGFLGKIPVLLMSSSGVRRGGKSSLAAVERMLTRFGAEFEVVFSLPYYHQNFVPSAGITDVALAEGHRVALEKFLTGI